MFDGAYLKALAQSALFSNFYKSENASSTEQVMYIGAYLTYS